MTCGMENSVPTPLPKNLELHLTVEMEVFPLSSDFPLVLGVDSYSNRGSPFEFSSTVLVNNFRHLEVEASNVGVLFLVTLGVDVEAKAP